MAEARLRLSEEQIARIEDITNRGSRVEVCQTKNELRIYEISCKLVRMDNTRQ